MNDKLISILIAATASLTVIAIIALTINWYLSLPIVAKNQYGECVWMDNEGDKELCPQVMPVKYLTIYVNG